MAPATTCMQFGEAISAHDARFERRRLDDGLNVAAALRLDAHEVPRGEVGTQRVRLDSSLALDHRLPWTLQIDGEETVTRL